MPLFPPALSTNPSAFIQLLDTKPIGTSGGVPNTSGWFPRTINTIKRDDTGLVTLLNNKFTLPAGTYEIDAQATFYRTSRTRMRLRNTTDNLIIIDSLNGYFSSGTEVQVSLNLSGSFLIASNKSLSIEYAVETSFNANSLGVATNLGGEEMFLIINLWKA